ncbi:hypothetical protein [Lentzea sp. E54]|uniref:hypothetical protein n=1 Tax=Lentzea xerophila TaxID=3435883 RepID=UPI003DA32682
MGERKAVTGQLARHYLTLNPAATRREIHALTDALATEVTRKYFPVKPYRGLSVTGTPHEATTPPTRAS